MLVSGIENSEAKMSLFIPRDTVARWSLLATEVFIVFIAAIYVGLDHGNPNLLFGFALGLLVVTPAFRLCGKSMLLSVFVGAIILIAVYSIYAWNVIPSDSVMLLYVPGIFAGGTLVGIPLIYVLTL
jgi:hypothetical protein